MYESRLSRGWLFGRKLDNSDRQYRSFRSNVDKLSLFAVLFLLFRTIYDAANRRKRSDGGEWTYRIPFFLGFSAVMLAILHGASALKVYALLLLNYGIAKSFGGTRILVPFIWSFNLLLLFSNDKYDGYRFGHLHPSLAGLDEWKGAYPRWNLSFNITVLRIISFATDYHWSLTTSSTHSKNADDEKSRSRTSHPPEFYNFPSFLAYSLYPPLYLAGPILSYNDFLHQLRHPSPPPWKSVASYALRFLFAFVTMDALLHGMHPIAMKDSHAFRGGSPAQLALLGFWNLVVVWFKLLLPWRFFRLWAMADGIQTIENMQRCVANNYSARGFWRGWHASFNAWLIRYIYVPVGGSKRVLAATVLTFSFVAIWHDISFRLLTWGWLIALFITPEILLSSYLTETKYGHEPWYRTACAVFGAFNILLMMTANLVGFVLGRHETLELVRTLTSSVQGWTFIAGALACLTIGVMVMFEIREEEKRRDIVKRF